MVIILLFFFQFFVHSNARNGSTPVVIWHGMGDCCCNPLSMGSVKNLIEKEIPGIYVHSLKLGSTIADDIEKGFFANTNELVYKACLKIQKDENLRNGYNAIGFSQGAQFLRAVAERCPNPPMLNLVSVGGQHQGVYGLPYCLGDNFYCNSVRKLLEMGAYTKFVQKRVVQAQYWHDPMDEKSYKSKSIFIANINNENNDNPKYKENFVKLKNLVLIKFSKDHMVVPKESSWFGFYAPNNLEKILPMNETELYIHDRIGLKTLHETGRIQFLEVDGDHLQVPRKFLVEEIIRKYFK